MNTAKTVLVFLICGLGAGLSFGALLISPRLLTFWFIKGDKFPIPTYRYYLGLGFFLLLGLAVAFSMCRITGLVQPPPNNAKVRETLSAIIVATSAVSIFAIASRIVVEDPVTVYMLSTAAFVLFISLACWLLTARLYYVGVFLNFLTPPAALVLLYVANRTLDIPGELAAYSIYFPMLAASWGLWIAAAQPSRK